MKFSDIKQFITNGNWECDYSIKSFVDTIEEWEETQGLQMSPDFQRGHVWNEKQQKEYVEFLLKGGKTARVIYLNNPTWANYKNKHDFVCVDGLQRSTAIFRFVKNEIKVFGHYYDEFEGSPRMMQGIKININDLKTRKEVLQWYLEFNSGGTVHTEEELTRVREMLEEIGRKNK